MSTTAAPRRPFVHVRPAQSEEVPKWSMPDLGIDWPDPITYLPNGWGVSISVIRPEIAEAMLALNSEKQRRKKPRYIGQYLRDMVQGRWELTHQGICFDEAGKLVDGQNRLQACVDGGSPFATLVYFGVGSSKEMALFDQGASRNAVDAAHVAEIGGANRASVSVVKAFVHGPDNNRPVLTNAFTLEQLTRYRAMLDFVMGFGYSPLLTAGERAAIGRAFYHAKRERLTRFVHILTDKESATEPGDKSVIALKVSLMSRHFRASAKDARERYQRCQRAIHAFLAREDLAKIYASTDDLFPMPSAHQIALANQGG